MPLLIKIFTSKQFLQFLIVGAFAAAVNFTSRIILNYWFSFNTSIVIAYFVGMAVAFLLFRRNVFLPPKNHSLIKEIIHFVIVNCAAVLQTLLVSNILLLWLLPAIHWPFFIDETAHLIGISVPVITSFLGHKYFTFNDKTL